MDQCDNGMRTGGPEVCPRPCQECHDGDGHHFADPMIGFVDESPEHPAALAGCDSWWECKHCDAWREYTGEEDFDESPNGDDE